MRAVTILSCVAAISFLSACGDEFYTMENFRQVRKIDTHMHLNAENPALVEQAAQDNFRLLTVNVDVPSYPTIEDQKRCALLHTELHPDRVNFLTAFTLEHWHSKYWADSVIAELKGAFANGALGIKLWKNIGMTYRDSTGNFIMVDNPNFDPVIKFIIQQDKTVLAHIGEPKNCWLPLDQMTVRGDREYFKNHPEYHMYLHPDYPSYENQIQARDRFVERHPDMRFVGAHLGSLEWSVDELAKTLDHFPNMAVDMAARISHLQYQSKADREKVRNFLIKYKDRIIYATDSGISPGSDPAEAQNNLHERWLSDWKYLATNEIMTVWDIEGEFQGLKLPKEVIDNIYYHNAVRWFDMKE